MLFFIVCRPGIGCYLLMAFFFGLKFKIAVYIPGLRFSGEGQQYILLGLSSL